MRHLLVLLAVAPTVRATNLATWLAGLSFELPGAPARESNPRTRSWLDSGATRRAPL
jgi:hypothetical protein